MCIRDRPDTVIKTTGILNKPLPFHHFLRKGLLPENWIGDDLNLHRKMDFLCVCLLYTSLSNYETEMKPGKFTSLFLE